MSGVSELIVMTADNSMAAVVKALLERPAAMGIRRLTNQYQVKTHPNFDAATFRTALETLRSQSQAFRHAMILCDRIGSGSGMTREEMELDLEIRLAHCGWEGRSAAIVIDPELDVWLWQCSPHVAQAIGWNEGTESIYQWLLKQGYTIQENGKPLDPKRALNHALYVARATQKYLKFFFG